MAVAKIIVFVITVLVGLVFFTLYRNDANLFQAPGFYQRLTTYLSSNTAETSANHAFEELRTPIFHHDAEKMYQRVLNAATKLGWVVLAKDDDNQNVNFVVRSPVFSFEDDVYVQVTFVDMDESSLYIQSSSRTGRADLAANVGHIQALVEKLQ
ncbi:hypothetical protein MNBD_GAMMA06-935 [hydrothermal vent metagenome]|uniref:DUF1499 domain-containing protein n=1 Tax=hydrothermal vent metagenome TaxID=652676 RepID=A0A3B0W5Z7_9ZZZZ